MRELPSESTSVLTLWSNIDIKKKQENPDLHDHNVEQLCPVIREEQAEELARVGLGNNAARRLRAMAILKSALAK